MNFLKLFLTTITIFAFMATAAVADGGQTYLINNLTSNCEDAQSEQLSNLGYATAEPHGEVDSCHIHFLNSTNAVPTSWVTSYDENGLTAVDPKNLLSYYLVKNSDGSLSHWYGF